MENLINYSIQLNLYLIVLLVCYYWGIRQSTNFRLNRLFLLSGITISILLPFLRFNFDNEVLTHLPSIQLQEYLIQSTAQTATSGTPIFYWLLVFYLTGVIIATSKVLYGIYLIFALKKSCRKTEEYYKVPNSNVAFSFMQSIFIGDDLSEEQKELVLQHEKVHLTKFHMLDLLLVQLLEVFLFYNPLVYRFNSLFREVHEYEADYYSSLKEENYITHLLSKHFDINAFAIVHQFNSNHLKSRIMRLTNNTTKKVSRTAVISCAIAFGILFLSNCGPEGLKPESTETKSSSIKSDKVDTEPREMTQPEIAAKFPGGTDALYAFIIENINYPETAKKDSISGTVFIQFTIAKDGTPKDFNILKGVNAELDHAALKTLQKMPHWTPAENEDKKVASQLTMPIKFKL